MLGPKTDMIADIINLYYTVMLYHLNHSHFIIFEVSIVWDKLQAKR